MPEECVTPVGMHTGLEPYTVYNTWQPEAYGSNSLENRQGIEGMYLLRSLPGDVIPLRNFVEGSLEFIYHFKRRINVAYPEDTHPLVRKSWDKWYETFAPLCNFNNGTCEEETSENYNDRMIQSGRFYNVRIPLFFILTSRTDTASFDWDITHKEEDAFDPTFQWPETLAAAMKSVTTTLDPNPHAPRLYAARDQELIASRDTFLIQVGNYLDDIKSKSVEKITEIVSRCVTYKGEIPSFKKTKQSMQKVIRTWCSTFFTIAFRPVNEVSATLISKYFSRFSESVFEAERKLSVICADDRKDVVIKRPDLKEWGDMVLENECPRIIFQGFVNLLQKRDNRICRTFKDVYESDRGYIPFKRSHYFSETFLTDCVGITSTESAVEYFSRRPFILEEYYRFYFTIWLDCLPYIVILEPDAQIFYIISPHLDRTMNFCNTRYNNVKECIVSFFKLLSDKSFDCSTFDIHLYPHQYHIRNESDIPADLETLLILYMLQVNVSIWYKREEHMKLLKFNFCCWLVTGQLPF